MKTFKKERKYIEETGGGNRAIGNHGNPNKKHYVSKKCDKKHGTLDLWKSRTSIKSRNQSGLESKLEYLCVTNLLA